MDRFPITLSGENVPIKLWTDPATLEAAAIAQLKKVAGLGPTRFHVAVMPDVHVGKGATIGSVIAMEGAVAPAAVGVDLGCGMTAAKTNLTASGLPDSLARLRSEIEAAIPMGFSRHADEIPQVRNHDRLLQEFGRCHPAVQDRLPTAVAQLGTLGGGNHFIELCIDNDEAVWMMLHSGSRNVGNQIAKVHIDAAKALPENNALPDRDLAMVYAGTEAMASYRHDALWAQSYALANRRVMFDIFLQVLARHFDEIRVLDTPIDCHHNYIAEETHFGTELLVTRKGAISAQRGEMGIIPGSMGAHSFIVRGLGNPESFRSAAHGAGRRMSRTKAKQRFTIRDLERQTMGIECRIDRNIVDEIPSAYKDIDEVMVNQANLVEPVAELRQVLCCKG